MQISYLIGAEAQAIANENGLMHDLQIRADRCRGLSQLMEWDAIGLTRAFCRRAQQPLSRCLDIGGSNELMVEKSSGLCVRSAPFWTTVQ
jgi:hypothetical protein